MQCIHAFYLQQGDIALATFDSRHGFDIDYFSMAFDNASKPTPIFEMLMRNEASLTGELVNCESIDYFTLVIYSASDRDLQSSRGKAFLKCVPP